LPRLVRLKPGAVSQYFDEPGQSGRVREIHSSTCSHCQHMTEFPSMRRMMEFVEICRGCMKLICLGCVGKPCVPFEKRVDIKEREDELHAKLVREGWRCY
jgi:hypothetical protein